MRYVSVGYSSRSHSICAYLSYLIQINSFLTSTFSSLRTSIQNDIGSVNNVISGFINTINKIPGVNVNAPSISVPSLDSLQNVTLPSDFTTALQNLNNSLPTISQLKSTIEDM